eukprot:TRINITY_DN13167_c0_g1_i1.p1 TRINITY_DN13167_c0_g1~~TRINITY_DN13167_c0_g1_i1.p1  ORF type:complete len:230 (-),score=40.09 TRINITY_DN13167_c0_g1_i1:238-900(-)
MMSVSAEAKSQYPAELEYAESNSTGVPPSALIIFDWDDTLLCTSYLNALDNDPAPGEVQNLRGIEKHAVNLLKTSLAYAHTVIVTNADAHWVRDSASKWMPALTPILEHVHVISTRSADGPRFVGEVESWKKQAFSELMLNLDGDLFDSVIAFGDRDWDIEAATSSVAEHWPHAWVKTVKLKELPTPAELEKQLGALAVKLEPLIAMNQDLTINLVKPKV